MSERGQDRGRASGGEATGPDAGGAVEQLLAAYADAISGLPAHGVMRSANSPIADFAEHLTAWH